MSRAVKFPVPLTPALRRDVDQFAAELDSTTSRAIVTALSMAMVVMKAIRNGARIDITYPDGTVDRLTPPYSWVSLSADRD